MEQLTPNAKRHKSVSYDKWGYFFIAPFFIVYAFFSLYPLISTIYFSFFKYMRVGFNEVGPEFIGLKNYIDLFSNGELIKYFGNTIIMWVIGFIPQIGIALLLAAWFTDLRLKLKALGFFKTVIYLPNLIMAAAFALLFVQLFANQGPINQILFGDGEGYRFFNNVWSTRIIIALMSFLMWFGNTTILLMAGIMGVDTSLYEASSIDGCTPGQQFRLITLPLIRPILSYVLITSLIGGVQMFDLPQVVTNGGALNNRTAMTVVMYLNENIGTSQNYGVAGAISVILFVITSLLGIIIFKSLASQTSLAKTKKKAV